ncbi:MAG: aminotransferase, partial [Lachnospiraceae bacterium]|nr:aminotransferase [Lachnospiraceae bacterium]
MKKPYKEYSKQELEQELVHLKKEYEKYQEMDLKLNMARGKPCKEQLDLSLGLMDALDSRADMYSEDGTVCRN